MAFNHEEHELDPVTGFQRHKDTKHLIGIEQAPSIPSPVGDEWPKWVVPHANHVVSQGVSVSTPHFTQHHKNRHDGVVSVLVHTAEEEELALAERPVPIGHQRHDEPVSVEEPIESLVEAPAGELFEDRKRDRKNKF